MNMGTALALMAVMAVHPLANSQNLSDQEVARIVSSGRYFPAARDFSLREKADTMEMRILYGFEYVIDTLSGKCLHEPYMLLTHYYSYNAYIRDSVQSEVYASERSKGMNAFTDITSSVIPEDQTATYYEIFRRIPSSSRYVLLRVQNTDYCYSEKPKQTGPDGHRLRIPVPGGRGTAQRQAVEGILLNRHTIPLRSMETRRTARPDIKSRRFRRSAQMGSRRTGKGQRPEHIQVHREQDIGNRPALQMRKNK